MSANVIDRAGHCIDTANGRWVSEVLETLSSRLQEPNDLKMITPRARIEAECRRRGTPEVAGRCVDLLEGRGVDDAFVVVLGGRPAAHVLGGAAGGRHGYWPRVWATRGLLHAWDDTAAGAVIAATTDPAWRVREMAAKVIARHHVGDALNAVAALRTDSVERVRNAAERAVRMLVAARA
jgi:hypothetical protein